VTGGDDASFGACPVPVGRYDRVVLGHGSGGTLSAALVRDVFLPELGDPALLALEDAATLDAPPAGHRLAVTTDGFVVRPPLFPGGDIGVLAVAGTVNDLAVAGAIAQTITAAFILEEGTPIELLRTVARSMARTAKEADVRVVAGDTKVVERGKGDGVFVTTTGLGFVPPGRSLSSTQARPGDRVVVSGTLGDHGIAILSVRDGLELETELVSDVAPLGGLVTALLDACPTIRCMRDPTRGGLASALTEICEASKVGARLDEASIPLKREVRAACEILGLDPLYVACEGRLVAIVPEADAERAVAAMRAHPLGREASVIGAVVERHTGRVALSTTTGGERFVLRLSGEQLPRIC
jgi:hydrogenase expression/formation protein HypE